MGMPCQINSIVKLNGTEFPSQLAINSVYTIQKSGYRIFPIEVPLQLVDQDWIAYADVVITRLTWASQETSLEFRIDRIYSQPFNVKQA